jgi:DNA-directed RNA polymerase subunit RPC12/RpoP
MEDNSIKCPCCGASYHGDVKSDYVNCTYCNSKIIIKEDDKITKKGEEDEIEEVKPNKVKNTKIGKRLLALGTGFILAFTSGYFINKHFISNNSKKDDSSSKTFMVYDEGNGIHSGIDFSYEYRLLDKRKNEISADMTKDDFNDIVSKMYNVCSKYFNYDHMLKDIMAAVYLVNYDYISDELRAELQSSNCISDEKENIMNYVNFINCVADYNQRTIHLSYLKGEKQGAQLLDLSSICYDDYDRKVSSLLFRDWFESYDLGKRTASSNNNLTSLVYNIGNFKDMSSGAYYNSMRTIGLNMKQFLQDYLYENFSRRELEEFFDGEKLDSMQFELKGLSITDRVDDELKYMVNAYSRISHMVLNDNNFLSKVLSHEKETAKGSMKEKHI